MSLIIAIFARGRRISAISQIFPDEIYLLGTYSPLLCCSCSPAVGKAISRLFVPSLSLSLFRWFFNADVVARFFGGVLSLDVVAFQVLVEVYCFTKLFLLGGCSRWRCHVSDASIGGFVGLGLLARLSVRHLSRHERSRCGLVSMVRNLQILCR